MVKKLYWYVVYWVNKRFVGTRFEPNKLGLVLGMEEKPQYRSECYCRCGVDKKGNFKIVEKYGYIAKMTRTEFRKWIADDRG